MRFKLRPYEAVYKRLVRFTVRKNKELTITYEQFLEFTKINKCHYCDAPIIWIEYYTNNSHVTRYNLDRINNDLGYTKENCVVCCPRCNLCKSDKFTYEEWKAIGELIKSFPCIDNNKVVEDVQPNVPETQGE